MKFFFRSCTEEF